MTTATTHTPGPWTITESPSSIFVRCGRRTDNHIKDGAPVAVIHKSHPAFTTEEQMTNARLIAAAPEMLTRIKELESSLAFILENSDGKPSRICAGYRDLVETQRKMTRALLAKLDGKAG